MAAPRRNGGTPAMRRGAVTWPPHGVPRALPRMTYIGLRDQALYNTNCRSTSEIRNFEDC
jgi:hypothetical protein